MRYAQGRGSFFHVECFWSSQANVTFEIVIGPDGRSSTLIERTLSMTVTFPVSFTHCHWSKAWLAPPAVS